MSDRASTTPFSFEGLRYAPRLNGTAEVMGFSGRRNHVEIPEVVHHHGRSYVVGSIFWYAFEDCTNVEAITLPNSITRIGNAAFKGCTNLKSVTLSGSLTEIPRGAFSGCVALSSVEVPDSVKRIAHGAFRDCTGLTAIVLPRALKYMTDLGHSWPENPFDGCVNLTQIDIPDSLVTRRVAPGIQEAVRSGDPSAVEAALSRVSAFEFSYTERERGGVVVSPEHPEISVLLESRGIAVTYVDYCKRFIRDTSSPASERLAELRALKSTGLLTAACMDALLAEAVQADALPIAQQMDEWGAGLPDAVYRYTVGPRGDEGMVEYSEWADYPSPIQSADMVAFILGHLREDDRVTIRESFLPSSPRSEAIRFLEQILAFSDAEHCHNKTRLLRVLAAADRADLLATIEAWGVFTKKNLDEALKVAVESKATQATAYLLDCKERLFGTGGNLNL